MKARNLIDLEDISLEDIDEIKKLDINGFTYDPYNSTDKCLTFVRNGEK